MRYCKGGYFDHAATSYPKPTGVRRALLRAITSEGGNPGRSAHALSLAGAARTASARERIASHFGMRDENGVVFTKNATEALNLAIHALIGAGGHVLCDDMAHNAMLRPLYALSDQGRVTLSHFSAREDMASLRARFRADTVLLCATHASNICSRTCDARAIGALCREMGVAFILDASQSAGHMLIDCDAIGADAVCLPAHKGLLGIMGAGAVLFPHPREDLPPFLLGGSGAFSRERGMPRSLPEHFEAGTLPLPAIAAFEAGVAAVERIGIPEIGDKIGRLEGMLWEGLGSTRGVRLHKDGEGGGILTFSHPDILPEVLADRLNGCGFAVRAGLHCAPLAHKTLGTPKEGAVRISLGYSNTKRECERFLRALDRALKDG